ncbi:MAG TPA: carboxymuconolactone decarboxylase family protein, partial [Dietzia sp.]|nr:carboxymuconolactone decarboxylase family protein [Dietzia sp.]
MSQPHSSASDPAGATDISAAGATDGATATAGRSPSRPRIRPGGFRELGPVGWAVNRVGARVTGSRDVHLFATLGHARRLFPAWLAYSGMMMPFGVLDRRTTELVILRVAHLRGSAYERAHHERIGARVGLDH